MNLKQKCKEIMREMRMGKLRNDLIKVDKNMCALHQEWTNLTKEEINRINRWEIYAHKCYKNIYRGGVLRMVCF